MRKDFSAGVMVRVNAPCKRGPNGETPRVRSMPDPGGALLSIVRHFGEGFYECSTDASGLSGQGRRLLHHQDDLTLASAFDEEEP